MKKPPGTVDRHRGKPGCAGGACVRLSAPDGEPRAAGEGALPSSPRTASPVTRRCAVPHRAAASSAMPWRISACGRLKGVAIATGTIKGSFHQSLIEQDCMACHSDHQGPKLTKRSRKPFSHGLLKETVRARCSSCHLAPIDTVHRDLRLECGQCHRTRHGNRRTSITRCWPQPCSIDAKGATAHRPTPSIGRSRAAASPAIGPRRGSRPHSTTTSTSCSIATIRRPAKPVTRTTTTSRYTCYGCHEHSQARVRAEHVEEGIRNFENCVECHRDPRVEPGEGESRGRGGLERD